MKDIYSWRLDDGEWVLAREKVSLKSLEVVNLDALEPVGPPFHPITGEFALSAANRGHPVVDAPISQGGYLSALIESGEIWE